MTIDERTRHALHERLSAVLGHEEAVALMSYLPPAGWMCAGSRKASRHIAHSSRAPRRSEVVLMPIATPVRDITDVHGYVERICFKTGPPRLVGAELERIVTAANSPGTAVPIPQIQDALRDAGTFPGGSVVTFEPGGQLELSSPPAVGMTTCWRALAADVQHATRALRERDLALLPTAIDPHREPCRQLTDPRYATMEAYFDRRGALGRVMMCSTAAVQVNLDAGRDATDIERRWRVLHAVGPALSAAFANSPISAGGRTGWKSTRQAVWLRLDPSRTSVPAGPDPATAWTRYALDARVMMVRNGADEWLSDPGFTFANWLGLTHQANGDRVPSVAETATDGTRSLRRATTADLAYHLTTLFPPVRPRGWLEVRYVDAQPADYWPVPLAVLTTLVDVPEAGEVAAAGCERVAHTWVAAARHGLDHPDLARTAHSCFTAVLDALPDLGVDSELIHLVEDYMDRYVARGRCPADGILREEDP